MEVKGITPGEGEAGLPACSLAVTALIGVQAGPKLLERKL